MDVGCRLEAFELFGITFQMNEVLMQTGCNMVNYNESDIVRISVVRRERTEFE